MKKSFSFLVSTFVCCAGFVRAAPLERDLGLGLTYHRIHQLPADLPAGGSERRQPCVLDLRYVSGNATDATALAAWLKFHATTHAPVFVLANAGTSRVLFAPLMGRDAAGSIVVVGAAAPSFNPDIAVKISPDAERRAYEALEHGTPIGVLLVENADKPRNDEARLAKEHVPDTSPQDEPNSPEPPAAPAAPIDEKPAKTKPPPPPVDTVLQRAVQLHRALLALKKI